MKPIQFSKHPETIEIDVGGPTICVYHKQYRGQLPQVSDCEFVEFDHLCEAFMDRDYFSEKAAVVFVGANKFFNPSTRFHPVFDVLQYGLPAAMQKYSVDTSPYIGPIWRVWTHFSLCGLPFGGYTYSYLLESHYTAWQEGVRDANPVSLDAIREVAQGHVAIDYKHYFAPPAVEVLTHLPGVHDEYQRLKERLFDEHDTIGPILKGLTDFSRGATPGRKVPQEHKIFETPDAVRIVRSDFKVDDYLTDQLLAKIAEVNAVCEVLQ